MGLYLHALETFSGQQGIDCSKQHAHLLSWVCIVSCHMGKYTEARAYNDKATSLAKKVFGESSWEHHRCLVDHVFILTQSFQRGADQEKEARKAYAMAERVETRATILERAMESDKVEDDRMREFSAFAHLRREAMHNREEDPPFMRKGRSDGADEQPTKGKARSKSSGKMPQASNGNKSGKRLSGHSRLSHVD